MANDPTLSERRAELERTLEVAYDEASEARVAVQDRGGSWSRVQAAEAKVTAAQVALDDFDAEHPEFVEARDAEEREQTEQAMRRAFTD